MAEVALLFPGQGAQQRGMATGLYGWAPVFTKVIDSVFGLMGTEGKRIRADWLGICSLIDIDDVRRAQPLLFAVDYALARMVLSWGVTPVALLGHSAGELVAATLAGVFTLEEAVRVLLGRVRAAANGPEGGMLAVAAGADDLLRYLTGDVAVAAVNGPRQTMLAGTTEHLRSVDERLRADDFTVRAVPARNPFHSPAMGPVGREAKRAVEKIPLRAPESLIYSGYTGFPLGAAEARDPEFWSRQLTDPVYFGPALDRLLARRELSLIEAGPGQTLTTFARRHRALRSGRSESIPLSPVHPDHEADRQALLAVADRFGASENLAATPIPVSEAAFVNGR
ncbi:acyltransferase domain-containing protein [Sciscionella marina]|uniref:acyltransferase domain-containing protein n=1 Tax=Sciscionella marina TaxID=508770 RepID=UPI0003A64AF7|nr:acyltransferase domain-containing protein [Sciscionella marina]